MLPRPANPWLWWQGPWGAPDGWVCWGWKIPPSPRGQHARERRPAHPRRDSTPARGGPAPALGVDDDGPRLVAVPPQHHAHGVPVEPVDVDGVGGLTRPEQRPAVDVDAEVVRLPVRVLALARRGQNEGL